MEFQWDEHESASAESMSVGQLMDLLSKYPNEMKVLFTWEGIIKPIYKNNIYEDIHASLLLDADSNFYKEGFAKDSKENES